MQKEVWGYLSSSSSSIPEPRRSLGHIKQEHTERWIKQGSASTMNSMAMCSIWRGMGSARTYLARDSTSDENKQPYHTGSVAARDNKDRAFRRAPAWKCQICYWCNIKDSWKRQHYHRHMEHKDTKSCRKLLELTHETDRHRWNILGSCKMRRKNFGETTTEEGHKVFSRGKKDKHEHDVGFIHLTPIR